MPVQHTLNGKRIIVTADSGKPEPKLSEHIPLDAEGLSVIHYFGYGSNKRQIEAYLLDNVDDIVYLEGYAQIGTECPYITPDGTVGTFVIQTLNKKKIRDIGRPPKNYIWLLNMDLIQTSVTTSGI